MKWVLIYTLVSTVSGAPEGSAPKSVSTVQTVIPGFNNDGDCKISGSMIRLDSSMLQDKLYNDGIDVKMRGSFICIVMEE